MSIKSGKIRGHIEKYHQKPKAKYKSIKHHMELLTPKIFNYLTEEGFTAKSKYFRDIITFDIETTTIDKKTNFMYIFMINVNGKTFYHYDWNVFISFVQTLKDISTMEGGKKFVIWVHNLSFEFAFIQQFFQWNKVFCTSPHKVIFCETGNIMFRCTYFMTNLSLAKIPKVYGLPIKKLVGDLDYRKIRLPKVTPLTPIEKCYCENDVMILYYLIQKLIETYGDFTPSKVPYTSTGFTRKHLRDKAKSDKQYGSLRCIVKEASPTNLVFYHMLERAFAGGYTHLNYIFNKFLFEPSKTPKGVRSRDKKSFYPSIMVKYKFPRKFFKAKKEKVFDLIKNDYAVIMDIAFLPIKNENGEIIKKGLQAKTSMTTISEHKCQYLSNSDIDNGRIYSCDICVTTITEQDFDIIQKYYDIGKIKVGRCYAAKKRYLPKTIVSAVLDLYENKTTLKDVKGVEQEYQRLKALLNSLYGCCVTSLVQSVINYNPLTFEFKSKTLTEEEEEEMLTDYKNNYTSLLLYQTGVYVTAYARHEILCENWHLGEQRVIYNDTDSTKYLYDDETETFFDEVNKQNVIDVEKALKYHKIDVEKSRPKDIKGRKHQLGEMSVESTYQYFKSLGAKRYVFSEEKDIFCTIAGLPKSAAKNYLVSGYGLNGELIGAPTLEQCFSKFSNQMFVPAELAHKNTHYYTTPQGEKTFTDFKGNIATVFVGTGISLIPQSFEMNLSNAYKTFIATHTQIQGFSHSERFSSAKNLTKIKTYWSDEE